MSYGVGDIFRPGDISAEIGRHETIRNLGADDKVLHSGPRCVTGQNALFSFRQKGDFSAASVRLLPLTSPGHGFAVVILHWIKSRIAKLASHRRIPTADRTHASCHNSTLGQLLVSLRVERKVIYSVWEQIGHSLTTYSQLATT